MSTVKALMETSRSWSEENLFRVQTKEEIARLKAEIEELNKLKTVIEEKDKKINEQEAELMKYRVQVYDLKKELQKSQQKTVKKKAISAKKGQLSPGRSSFSVGSIKKGKKTVGSGDSANLELQKALSFLEKEEAKVKSSPSLTRATPPVRKKSGISTLSVKDAKIDRSMSIEVEEGHTYEFDMRALADAVPGIPLEVALDAEERFVKADDNGNGLLDTHELKNVIPAPLFEITPGIREALPDLNEAGDVKEQIIKGACKACNLTGNHMGDFDFLDTVKMILKLKEWATPSALQVRGYSEPTPRSTAAVEMTSPRGDEVGVPLRLARSRTDKATRLQRGKSEVSQACFVM